MCLILAFTQFSALFIKHQSNTRNKWAKISSLHSLLKNFLAMSEYVFGLRCFFPSMIFNPNFCFAKVMVQTIPAMKLDISLLIFSG